MIFLFKVSMFYYAYSKNYVYIQKNEFMLFIFIFSDLSYQKALDKKKKYGPLDCKKTKKNRRIRDVLKPLCRMFAVLVENWLLLYSGENDDAPTLQINLNGYRATGCQNATAKRKDCFEITHETNESHQFYAFSTPDMEQWISAINNVSIKQRKLTRKLPTPPADKKIESPLSIMTSDDDICYPTCEDEEIYELPSSLSFSSESNKSQSDNDINQENSTFTTPLPPQINDFSKSKEKLDQLNQLGNEDTKSVVSLPIINSDCLSKDKYSPRKLSMEIKPIMKEELPTLPPRAPISQIPAATKPVMPLNVPNREEIENVKSPVLKSIKNFETLPNMNTISNHLPSSSIAPATPPKPIKVKPQIPAKPKIKKIGLSNMPNTSGGVMGAPNNFVRTKVIEELVNRQKIEKKQID